MIDRTSLDLRIAEHRTTIARANETGWRQGRSPRHPLRAALAAALVALAARLAPETRASGTPGRDTAPAAA